MRGDPPHKPLTNQMNRIQLNKELTQLREEREKAQREVDNIQACMNELMKKRNELDMEQEERSGQMLFDQMFGG
ncbi:hypothetical protein Syn7803US43_63 [Synechococcus phage ACG-2014f]|uniref:Uncharacterized protein n=1 Tax=Synechococcus phage ACG-2014f TaxID=1493511 RepID=A0A0E3FQL7_9CAUD|nr:hypothetical protein Syn7803US43_63 [Synechococcus phage ACG-2014f]